MGDRENMLRLPWGMKLILGPAQSKQYIPGTASRLSVTLPCPHPVPVRIRQASSQGHRLANAPDHILAITRQAGQPDAVASTTVEPMIITCFNFISSRYYF